MTKLTKEWLHQQIYEIELLGLTDAESNTLAAFRVALESMEQEQKFNESTERPAAKMARIIRENPHPTNMCDMPVVEAVPDDSDPRDAFEAVFPMPKYAERCGAGYCVTAYSAWDAINFTKKWEGWNACRTAMLQTDKSLVIPDGWKLVPLKPTREMVQTVADEVHRPVFIRAVYETMLAASPREVR